MPIPIVLSFLLLAGPLCAQSIQLVKDINQTDFGGATSWDRRRSAVEAGGYIYAAGLRPDVGEEVFRFPVAGGPASLVADLRPGTASSFPVDLIQIGPHVVFRSTGASGGYGLYHSIAATGQTSQLGPPTAAGGLEPIGPRIYVSADDGVTGSEPWVTDGTDAGTVLLVDAEPGPSGSFPGGFVQFGSDVVFFARNGSDTVLWTTDGTPAGTRRGPAIPQMGFVSSAVALPSGELIVITRRPNNRDEIWRTDGTIAGTFALRTGFVRAAELTEAGGRAYFRGWQEGGTTGEELWTSDGTVAGTIEVIDLWPGVTSSGPSDLTAFGGRLVFAARSGLSRYGLYTSDGTAAGTFELQEMPVYRVGANEIAVIDNQLVFPGRDPATGSEPWVSDGTIAGTRLLVDLVPGPVGSFPIGPTAVSGGLLFAADPGRVGHEPIGSDLTAAGTRLLTNIWGPPFTRSSNPSDALDFFGTTLFVANDGIVGSELWRSDGTEAGTVLVRDVRAGLPSSQLRWLGIAGAWAFFSANDGTGRQLWRTDGTTAGTSRVGNVEPVSRYTAAVGDVLYFVGRTAAAGTEVWRTDGSTAGTAMVADLTPGPASSASLMLEGVGGLAYFRRTMQGGRTELWRTDGTVGGTIAVHPIAAWAPHRAYRGELFFTGPFGNAGIELLRTSGTTASLVADISPGSGDSYPDHLTVVGDTLFFQASVPGIGFELFKTDSTAAGTTLVADTVPGSTSGDPRQLVPWGRDELLFEQPIVNGFGQESGARLWRSDGTAAGTAPLTSPFTTGGYLGLFFPAIAELTAAGQRRAYFVGFDSATGSELWQTDGTPAGTSLVVDIAPGLASSTPSGLTLSSGRLLFAVDDGISGRELFAVDPGATVQSVGRSCAAQPALMLRLASDDPVLGGAAVIRGAGAAPASAGAVLVGRPLPVPAPLAGSCSLYFDLASAAVLAPVTAVAGTFQVGVRIPSSTALLGVQVVLQAALGPSATPLGADVTQALRWSLGR